MVHFSFHYWENDNHKLWQIGSALYLFSWNIYFFEKCNLCPINFVLVIIKVKTCVSYVAVYTVTFFIISRMCYLQFLWLWLWQILLKPGVNSKTAITIHLPYKRNPSVSLYIFFLETEKICKYSCHCSACNQAQSTYPFWSIFRNLEGHYKKFAT